MSVDYDRLCDEFVEGADEFFKARNHVRDDIFEFRLEQAEELLKQVEAEGKDVSKTDTDVSTAEEDISKTRLDYDLKTDKPEENACNTTTDISSLSRRERLFLALWHSDFSLGHRTQFMNHHLAQVFDVQSRILAKLVELQAERVEKQTGANQKHEDEQLKSKSSDCREEALLASKWVFGMFKYRRRFEIEDELGKEDEFTRKKDESIEEKKDDASEQKDDEKQTEKPFDADNVTLTKEEIPRVERDKKLLSKVYVLRAEKLQVDRERAMDDMRQAILLEPQNREFRTLYESIKKQFQKDKKKADNVWKGAFGGSSKAKSSTEKKSSTKKPDANKTNVAVSCTENPPKSTGADKCVNGDRTKQWMNNGTTGSQGGVDGDPEQIDKQNRTDFFSARSNGIMPRWLTKDFYNEKLYRWNAMVKDRISTYFPETQMFGNDELEEEFIQKKIDEIIERKRKQDEAIALQQGATKKSNTADVVERNSQPEKSTANGSNNTNDRAKSNNATLNEEEIMADEDKLADQQWIEDEIDKLLYSGSVEERDGFFTILLEIFEEACYCCKRRNLKLA